MASLKEEITEALQLDVDPIIEQIKSDGGGLQGLARIIEEVVIPLVGAQKAAIVRLSQEVDQLRYELTEMRRDE